MGKITDEVVEVGWSGRADSSLRYPLDVQVEKEKTVGCTNPELRGEVWAGALKLGVIGQIRPQDWVIQPWDREETSLSPVHCNSMMLRRKDGTSNRLRGSQREKSQTKSVGS